MAHAFEGYSATTLEGSPPWYGSWLPPGAQHPVIDRHQLFVVYTSQVEEVKTFFRHLKLILELKAAAGQEVVLVEQVAVWLMEGGFLLPGS